MAEGVEIRLLSSDDFDLVLSAEGLFDHQPIPQQTAAFLASDRDFIWFAMEALVPIGFVSASVILHPDKLPHLFVNERATREDRRRRGVARMLLQTVVDFGKSNSIWPLGLAAEGDDEPAKAVYRSPDGFGERDAVVFEWEQLPQSHFV
ncbi:MAG: GNAT family N-acetyltransferase [Erythrobacter sp.]|jgi:GNAT superfamily N-acetyltransferase